MSTDSRVSGKSVVLRLATTADDPGLRRLAQLDSRTVPGGQLLVAEVNGDLRAAYSALEHAAIADPFQPSAHLIELLEAHAWRRSPSREPAPGGLRGLARRAPWPA